MIDQKIKWTDQTKGDPLEIREGLIDTDLKKFKMNNIFKKSQMFKPTHRQYNDLFILFDGRFEHLLNQP